MFSALVSAIVPQAQTTEISPGQKPEVFAFHVNWDDASKTSLLENIDNIDVLLPEWLHIASANGLIEVDDPEGTADILDAMRNKKPHLKIAPLINNYAEGKWQAAWLNQTLRNSQSRSKLVDQILAFVVAKNFIGITIDFQDISPQNANAYQLFNTELYQRFHHRNLSVFHTLHLHDDQHSAKALAEVADGIVLIGYDQNRATGAPGPLAAQDWFEEGLISRFLEVSASKLIIALANHAYQWDGTGSPPEALAYADALTLAQATGAVSSFDTSALNPLFTYDTAPNQRQEIWLLDAVTAFNQLKAALPYQPRGVALWRLGTEDPGIWKLFADLHQLNPSDLTTIPHPTQINYRGSGEIIRLTSMPQVGARTIKLSDDGQRIIAENITRFPRSYELVQWGAQADKLLALTFDDGPDPVFSSQILDTLARYNVPATFFIVGTNALKYPKLVQRMVDQGHEVGSHTYSHVNISKVSADFLRFELSATQRVFESITGRNLVLFRAPYATDTVPKTAAEARPLSTVSDLGYYTVNMNIDPKDWWLPDAQKIADRVISGAMQRAGNVVLLHDAGGDRTQTVAALPMLIEHLQAEGFRFITVGELIGKSPDQTMPLIAPESRPHQVLQNAGFVFLREMNRFLYFAFFLAIFLGVFRSVLVLLISFARRPQLANREGPLFSVGIIVPAYNEEKVVLKTVYSLLKSRYRDLQILVVDDGSTDRTYEICRAEFANHPKVTVVTKPNAGKSEALNLGFDTLETDIIVAIDADTVFLHDTVSKLVNGFNSDNVAAISGNAKVGNRLNLLTKWQALEYITAQNLDRRAFEHINGIAVVPGAVGAWRRDAVLEAGGFTTDTLAEDADLTIRLIRLGYKVGYIETAIALTEAPETISQFIKQRFRWMFGMMQVVYKHRSAMALKDSKAVGLATIPNILIFQIIFPLFAPIIDLVALIILGEMAWNAFTDSTAVDLGGSVTALIMFFAFILLDFFAAATAFWHEKREDKWLLIWLLPQRFFYRQLIYFVAIKAMLAAIQGSMVGWGTLKRSASVKLQS